MNKKLQAEIWEIQVWIMWILALLLKQTGHMILFWLVLVWSIITSIGIIRKITEAIIEEKAAQVADKW